MTSRTIPAACFALPFLLITATAAHAQAIACADLAAIVESADADFAPIRGPLQSSIMPGADPLRRALSTKFEVHLYATTRPLAGAGTCEIRLLQMEDARAALRESTYRCEWPSRHAFAAVAQSMDSCLRIAAIREEAPELLRLHLPRDRSGEGERSVQVSVDAGAAHAASLSSTKLVCHERSPGGCDKALRR